MTTDSVNPVNPFDAFVLNGGRSGSNDSSVNSDAAAQAQAQAHAHHQFQPVQLPHRQQSSRSPSPATVPSSPPTSPVIQQVATKKVNPFDEPALTPATVPQRFPLASISGNEQADKGENGKPIIRKHRSHRSLPAGSISVMSPSQQGGKGLNLGAFDPLLSKDGQGDGNGSKVWSGTADDLLDLDFLGGGGGPGGGEHPLKGPSSHPLKQTKQRGAQSMRNLGSSPPSSSKASPTPFGMSLASPVAPKKQHGGTKRQNAKHRNAHSLPVSELRSIAAALSLSKPRANTPAEEAALARENHHITLGDRPKESTGTNRTHRRKGSVEGLGLVPSMHKKRASSDQMGGLLERINDRGGGRSVPPPSSPSVMGVVGSVVPNMLRGRPATPPIYEAGGAGAQKGRKGSPPGPSGRKGSPPLGNSRKSPVGGAGSRKSPTGGSARAKASKENRNPSGGKGTIPQAPDLSNSTKVTTRLTPKASSGGGGKGGNKSIVVRRKSPPPPADNSALSLRSSEEDPTDHQIAIPPSEEFLLHARCCKVLDQYRLVDQNFDFGLLVGKSRMYMEGFLAGSQGVEGNGGLIEAHRPIVKSVLETADDLVVEGFFYEERDEKEKTADADAGSSGEKGTHDRVEVAVFFSQKFRQFVVCYRGASEVQVKPVRSRQVKHCTATNNLHPTQPVTVFPPFRDAYFCNNGKLEMKVFALLDELSDRYPFTDVVTTGHSFGAALATIGAMRYANGHPMIRVACSGFGSPRVGGMNFRRLVNSLPNLKVMRVEYGSDPFVHTPDTAAWVHVGHTIVISTSDPSASGSSSSSGSGTSSAKPLVKAFRFDKCRAGGGAGGAGSGFLGINVSTINVSKSVLGVGGKNERNADREIFSYVRAVEGFTHLGLPWVKEFVGVGKGVTAGNNSEKRLVV